MLKRRKKLQWLLFVMVMVLTGWLYPPENALAAIAHRASASNGNGNASLTINKPAGTVSGDVMIANFSQVGYDTNGPSLSGWTQVASQDLGGGTERRGTVLRRVADSTDDSMTNYTFSISGANNSDIDAFEGAISTFSGVDTSTPVEVTGGYHTDNSASSTGNAITTLTDNAMVIYLIQVSEAVTLSAWTPGTFTEIVDANYSSGGNGATVGSATRILAAHGTTGNGSATLSDNVRSGGILIALKPIVPPTVTLGLTGSPMAEAAGASTVTATLSGTYSSAVTVNLSFSGTATLTDDYTRSGTSIVIGAGDTTGTVTLTAVQDLLDEDNETVIVDIDSVTNGTENGTQQVTATITDDDAAPAVTLGLTGSPMAEAAGVGTVTATLSAASGLPVTVDLGFTGTATLTNDYTRSGTSIVIGAGDTTGTVTLTAEQDLLDEDNETVIVDVDAVTNGTESGTQQVTATITDDDAAPTVTLGLTGSPMAEAAGVGTVTATLSAASGLPVTVDLGFTGTATLTDDYTRSGTSIVIGAGDTTGTVTLTAVQDLLDEDNETVIVDIDAVTNGTESGTQQVTATITDDDAAPTVTLGLTGSPMAEAAGVGMVTATLSAASGLPVTVDLGYTGTATLTNDYTRSGTSIVIAAGDTTGTVTLTAVQDLLDEDNETVIVDIDSVTNGTESGTQQVTATINDDDAAPSLSINDVTDAEGNAGTTDFDFTVTLSAASGITVTVDYATSNGTATTADSDYAAGSGQLTFAPGDLTKTVTVAVTGDAKCELDETFAVGLSNPANATISDDQGQGTITNDDSGPASCAITAPESVIYGSTGNITSTVATPGATYAWVIYVDGILNNGLITAGQNSPQITWTAPVSFTVIDIGVTVTTEGGCVCENDPPVAGGDGGAVVTGSSQSGSIPTLSEWGMIVLGLLMAGTAVIAMRRKNNMTV